MGARDATESIEQLLQSLEQLEHGYLQGKEEDLAFLRDMLKTPEFHSLLQAHHVVSVGTQEESPSPVTPSAVMLANEMMYDAENGALPEEAELAELLSSPHISALLMSHDRVANKEWPLQPMLTPTEREGGEFEMTGLVRVVQVEKEKDPLGATVKCDEEERIVISRILAGGIASRTGALHQGDIVHEINDKAVQGWSIDQVATYMQTLTGTVKFKISPAIDAYTATKKSKASIYIRSFVSYDPKDDPHHPCPEAGLILEQGVVLRVVDQDDLEWWQAIRVDEEEEEGVGQRKKKARLIPSKQYMELKRAYSSMKKKRSRGTGGKAKLYSVHSSELLGKQLVAYEEMARVGPREGRPRPIMLIAPRNGPFKLDDLREQLLKLHPTFFGSPIPHTTRRPGRGEREGEAFHFVKQSQMERDIRNGEIIEYGMLNGFYTGVSINSIRRVINSAKTCLLVLSPEAIKVVRQPELRPFIVYFRSPSTEQMKRNWVKNKIIKVSEVVDIVRQAGHLEKTYSHYFDHYLPFDELESAIQNIVTVANNLRSNDQWVPANWIRQ